MWRLRGGANLPRTGDEHHQQARTDSVDVALLVEQLKQSNAELDATKGKYRTVVLVFVVFVVGLVLGKMLV